MTIFLSSFWGVGGKSQMNVPRGYEGAKNEAFLSLRNRQVPHRLHDPPSPFVTYLNSVNTDTPKQVQLDSSETAFWYEGGRQNSQSQLKLHSIYLRRLIGIIWTGQTEPTYVELKTCPLNLYVAKLRSFEYIRATDGITCAWRRGITETRHQPTSQKKCKRPYGQKGQKLM